MYFNAALAYDTGPTPEGDADVRRIYDKCIQARIQSAPGCSEVAALMDEWSRMRPGAPGGQGAAGRQGAPQSAGGASYILPGQSRAGGSSQPATEPTPPEMDIDEAIRKAKAKLAGRPGTIDGCPTNIRHLESELPVCSNNEDLIKLRELILATDASFVDDQAAGYSLRQVATLAAQAARQHEETLKSAERSMFETSAHEGMARRRLDALRQMPPVCDAGPRGSFGMTENAYQIYVNAFMTSKANRAVSAVAACRARAAPR
ncbi:MAG: hypothetical protein M9951_19430 [Burkholderiaceae bacterium]|nr:hypothetical protein [Burkholderiaceae bacterium]MEB2318266.1 hypothetical protein [Pseudomonadota bacterium]